MITLSIDSLYDRCNALWDRFYSVEECCTVFTILFCNLLSKTIKKLTLTITEIFLSEPQKRCLGARQVMTVSLFKRRRPQKWFLYSTLRYWEDRRLSWSHCWNRSRLTFTAQVSYTMEAEDVSNPYRQTGLRESGTAKSQPALVIFIAQRKAETKSLEFVPSGHGAIRWRCGFPRSLQNHF